VTRFRFRDPTGTPPSYNKCGLTMMYHRTSRAIYWT